MVCAFYRCEGKSACSVFAPGTLGDPCPGINKYSVVNYTCVVEGQWHFIILCCKWKIGQAEWRVAKETIQGKNNNKRLKGAYDVTMKS